MGVVNTPSSITAKVGANTELQSELAANASVAQQAQREATEQEKAPEQAQMRSNRDQLSTAFQRQNLKGAQNVVNESGANRSYVEGQKTSGAAAEGRPFSREWLDKNGLVVSGKLESDAKGVEKQLVKDGERLSRAYRGAPQVFDDKSKTAAEMPNQPSANQVGAARRHRTGGRGRGEETSTSGRDSDGRTTGRGEPAGSVDRYRQRLQEQSQQSGQNPAQPPTPLGLAADYSSSRQAGAVPREPRFVGPVPPPQRICRVKSGNGWPTAAGWAA